MPTSRLQNIRYLVRVCFLVRRQPLLAVPSCGGRALVSYSDFAHGVYFALREGFLCFSHVVKCISLLLWLLDFEAWLERLPLLHGYKGICPGFSSYFYGFVLLHLKC